ncbi:MAG: hypothetical protein JJ896_11170 [Rhodothermales bacterium]|nr:hypothetical protein [Rhodothermales bacterium]MBO6780202.1 hypothetical protein [Rhodothermales bacterium]
MNQNPSRLLLAATFVAFAAILGGCTTSQSAVVTAEAEASEQQARADALERQLAEARAELDAAASAQLETREQLSRLQQQVQAQADAEPPSAESPSGPSATAGGINLLPPDAEPGMCYSRLYVEPELRTVTEQVVIREAGERIETIPAEYETVTQRVLIKEAGEKVVEIKPAVYEWQTEQIEVRPASFRLEEVPAEYEERVERILVRPARTVWKPSEGRIYGAALVDSTQNVVRDASGNFITTVDTDTGTVMCLIEEPAEYREVTRRVLVTAATTRRVEIPAEYESVRKQVMVREPEVITREIPAQYE